MFDTRHIGAQMDMIEYVYWMRLVLLCSL